MQLVTFFVFRIVLVTKYFEFNITTERDRSEGLGIDGR